MEELKIAVLSLDILILSSLVLSLLFGFLKGLPKGMNKLIITAVSVGVFFIILSPVTKSLVNTKLQLAQIDSLAQSLSLDVDLSVLESAADEHGQISVNTTVNYFVSNQLTNGTKTETEVGALAASISSVAFRIVAYIICIIIMYIVRILLSIIFAIIRKILHIKLKKLPKHRLLGMLPSFGKCILNFIVLDLPLFGLIFFANGVMKDLKTYQEELNLTPDVVEVMDAYCEATDSSIVKQVIIKPLSLFTSGTGMDADLVSVDNILTFTHDNYKVKLVSEYSTIIKATAPALKIYGLVQGNISVLSFNSFTDEDIDGISNLIRDSKIIKLVIPAGIELLQYQDDSKISNLALGLKDVNISEDLNKLANAIEIIKDYKHLTIDLNRPLDLINNKTFVSFSRSILSELINLDLVNRVVIPHAIDKLEQNYGPSSTHPVEYINFETLKEVSWPLVSNQLVPIIFGFIDVFNELELRLDTLSTLDYKTLINNPNLPNAVDKITNTLDSSSLFKETMLPMIIDSLANKIETDPNLNRLIVAEDFRSYPFASDFKNIFKTASVIITSIQNVELDLNNPKACLKHEALSEEIGNVIDAIVASDVFSDFILPIAANKLIDKVETAKGVEDFNINFNKIRTNNWREVVIKLKKLLMDLVDSYRVLDIESKSIMEILTMEGIETHLEVLALDALDIRTIRRDILPKLANKINVIITKYEDKLGEFAPLLKELITEDSMESLFRNDVTTIVNILRSVKIAFLDQQMDLQNEEVQDEIITILHEMFNLSIIEGKEQVVIESLLATIKLDETLETYGVTLAYENVTDWNQELDNLCDIFKNIMKLTNDINSFDFNTLFNNESSTERLIVIDTLTKLAESELIGDSMFTIVNKLIENVSSEYVVTFTDADKETIKNETTWRVEFTTIFELIDQISTIENVTDMQSLDVTNVRTIIETSTKSVIASKILGTILANVLGDAVTFDLTDRTTLANAINVICNAIELSKIISNPSSLDLNDQTQVDNFINNINALASNDTSIDLANQLINQMTSPETPVNVTGTEITEASNIINTVIEAYQNDPDQSTFNVSDLDPETIQSIEDNELASLLLGFLF